MLVLVVMTAMVMALETVAVVIVVTAIWGQSPRS
jgi:hypothetical protein